MVRRATAFVIAAALPFYLAVSNGGYDLVVRQEVGLVVWIAIGIAVTLGVLPRARVVRAAWLPLMAALALGALTFLSLSWTGSSEHTLAEVARVATYAGVVALALLGLNRYTWKSAAAGLGAAAVGICVLAIASRLQPGWVDNPVPAFFDTDRLSYPLNYWNAVAAWGAITLAMALAWSANASRLAMRVAGLAATPVAGLAIYLTYSRGGVASAVVAAVAVLALSRNRWTAGVHCLAAAIATGGLVLAARSQPEIAHATGNAGAPKIWPGILAASAACGAVAAITRSARIDEVRLPSTVVRRLVPVALIVGVLIAVVAGHGVISKGWQQFTHQKTAAESSNPTARLATTGGSRHDIWDAALDDFNAHPWGGSGPGTFEFWWAENGTGHEFVRNAHSLYLQELAELGLPGLLVLVLFIGSLLVLALLIRVRARRSSTVAAATAMCAAGIVFLFHAGVDWLWEETAVGVLGIGALAVAAAGLSSRRERRTSWGVRRISIVAGAGVAALVLMPGLVSSSREGQSEAALRAGQLAEAESLANDSVQAASWGATPYQQRAAIEDRQGRLRAARDDLSEAIANEPVDWRQQLQMSQVELELGHDAVALAHYRRSNDLNHVSPPFASFEAFRRAASPGCLILGPLTCRHPGGLISPESCLTPSSQLTAALGLSGATAAQALTRRDVYYVAAETPNGPALWFADRPAFRAYGPGYGVVVPLNEQARRDSPIGTNVNPLSYAASSADIDAYAAIGCLKK